MERAIEKEKELIGKGYFTIEAAAEYTGMHYGSLLLKLKKYKPDSYYSAEGFLVAVDSPHAIKGRDLIFRPSSRKGILIHPSLVARWKQEKEAATTIAKGASFERLGESRDLPANVEQQLKQKEPGNNPEVGS